MKIVILFNTTLNIVNFSLNLIKEFQVLGDSIITSVSMLPVISTPVGSNPSLIDDSSGILCELNDFEKNIEDIYHNYYLAKQSFIKLYEILCCKFLLNSIVNQHEKINKNLVKS